MSRPKGSVNRSLSERKTCSVTVRFSESKYLVLVQESQSRCLSLSAHIQDLVEVGREVRDSA
jgi:hypothetical protein